jgi:hypothetical protein
MTYRYSKHRVQSAKKLGLLLRLGFASHLQNMGFKNFSTDGEIASVYMLYMFA